MTRHKALDTSASDRWFTPPDLLAEIRTFLGDFYDPCSARIEGERIDSGLWQSWQPVVYCNPPYGRAIGPWIVKAMTEPVDELLMLVPARTETKWFTPCFEHTILFLHGRLKFTAPGRESRSQGAPFPSALVYRGPRVEAFYRAFAHRGPIVRRVAA